MSATTHQALGYKLTRQEYVVNNEDGDYFKFLDAGFAVKNILASRKMLSNLNLSDSFMLNV